MIHIRIFDGECRVTIDDGYMDDFMKLCAEYKTANISLYHLAYNERGKFFNATVGLPVRDWPPFLNHCRHRHNVKIYE